MRVTIRAVTSTWYEAVIRLFVAKDGTLIATEVESTSIGLLNSGGA